MSKAAELLIKRVNAEIEAGRVRKADIRRTTGWHSALLETYLQGKSVPGLENAEKLAAAIGMSLADALAGMDPPPPREMSAAEALQVLARTVGTLIPVKSSDPLLALIAELSPADRETLEEFIKLRLKKRKKRAEETG